MADQLKLRGGPTAEAQVFVGAEREVTVDPTHASHVTAL